MKSKPFKKARGKAPGNNATQAPPRMLRKLLPSILVAALTALIASRINTPLVIPPAPPHSLLSEVIPEVDLDTRTFERAVNSLAKRTHARLVLDPTLAEALAKDVERPGGPEPNRSAIIQHFKNIQLGSIIARLLDEWGDRLPAVYRIENNTITFSAPSLAVPETCIYNVRNLAADWRAWQTLAHSWEPPQPPPPPISTGGGAGLFGGGGGGLFGNWRLNRQYERDDDELAFRLAAQIPGKVDSEDFKIIAIWSGCIIIETTPKLHDEFKHLLVTLVQRQSPIHGATP
jgi:hypothetical protein